MAWRDNLRTASFRGVEFKVEGHDAEFGRRKVTHEYPQRDKPFTEDLGRKADGHTIDAYLIGDDYAAARDRLIDACQAEGAGQLVHPYLGNMRVDCMGIRLRETAFEGRMCRLQLMFVEAGEAAFPSAGADLVANITTAANDAMEAASSGFLDKFSINGFPSFVVDGASDMLGGFSDMVAGLTVNPMAAAQSVADFTLRVRALKSQALNLVRNPVNLANQVLGVVSSLREVFGVRSNGVLRLMRQSYSQPASSPANTPNRVQQQQNEQAFAALIRQAATAEQAKEAAVRASESAAAVAASRSTEASSSATDDTTGEDSGLYQSRDDAISIRDEINDSLDEEMEDPATESSAYQAFARLRTEVVRGIPDPSLRLPSLATVTPKSTLPSLVVSYQFYADAGRAVEIARRNKVPYPGFLQGGKPLEVLTDG